MALRDDRRLRLLQCGGRDPSWFVASDRFNTALNSGAIVCPTCFVFAHEEATGMYTSWELVPASPFRWIEYEGRPTPWLATPEGKAKDE